MKIERHWSIAFRRSLRADASALNFGLFILAFNAAIWAGIALFSSLPVFKAVGDGIIYVLIASFALLYWCSGSSRGTAGGVSRRGAWAAVIGVSGASVLAALVIGNTVDLVRGSRAFESIESGAIVTGTWYRGFHSVDYAKIVAPGLGIRLLIPDEPQDSRMPGGTIELHLWPRDRTWAVVQDSVDDLVRAGYVRDPGLPDLWRRVAHPSSIWMSVVVVPSFLVAWPYCFGIGPQGRRAKHAH